MMLLQVKRDNLKTFTCLIVSLVSIQLFLTSEALANYAAGIAARKKGDFISAAGNFFQAYTYPRDKAEKAKAEWGLAESLQRLGLMYSASKYYSVIVRRGPGGNPFFRGALEELGKINSTLSLGQSHIVQLFRTKIDPSYVPGPARGFYFYYLGVEAYSQNQFEISEGFFKRVPSGSPYFTGALFHLGVVSNLAGRHGQAVGYFENVLQNGSGISKEMRDSAMLNLARIFYETKRYVKAINYYGQVTRNSTKAFDNDNEIIPFFSSSLA